MIIKICEYCKKEYRARHRKRKYCSVECAKLAITKYKRQPCVACGRIFKPLRATHTFCSHKCREGRYGVLHNKEGKDKRFCTYCKRYLNVSAFYKCKTGYKGLSPQCKFCSSVKNACVKYNLTRDDYMNLLKRQKWKCGICGKSLKLVYTNPEKIGIKKDYSISIDHIDPKGRDKLHNYQAVHWSCNTMKSNKNMKQLLTWCNNVIRFNGLK